MGSPIICVERSQDIKLSKDKGVSATWVSQASCPKSCPFYKNGCYAETGRAGMHTRRINASQREVKYTVVQLAKLEAAGIRELTGTRPLRLHVVGDCKTSEAARTVSAAGMEYAAKHNQPVWTYTHAKRVPRKDWGTISVLRSCQSVEEMKREHKRGYAGAIVWSSHFKDSKAIDLGDGFKGIPCPYQTGKVKSCKDCGLCMKDKNLHASKIAILFAPDRGTDTKIANAIAKG